VSGKNAVIIPVVTLMMVVFPCPRGNAQDPCPRTTVFELRGRVVDASTMLPLSGVEITVSELSQRTKSDSAGVYVLPASPRGGQVAVGAFFAGYFPDRQGVWAVCDHDLPIGGQGSMCTKHVDFYLRPAKPLFEATRASCNLSGSVRSARTGEALAGTALGLSGTGLGTLAGPDGEFRLHDVPAGLYPVRLDHVGFTWEETIVVVACGREGTAARLRFWLSPDPVWLN